METGKQKEIRAEIELLRGEAAELVEAIDLKHEQLSPSIETVRGLYEQLHVLARSHYDLCHEWQEAGNAYDAKPPNVGDRVQIHGGAWDVLETWHGYLLLRNASGDEIVRLACELSRSTHNPDAPQPPDHELPCPRAYRWRIVDAHPADDHPF